MDEQDSGSEVELSRNSERWCSHERGSSERDQEEEVDAQMKQTLSFVRWIRSSVLAHVQITDARVGVDNDVVPQLPFLRKDKCTDYWHFAVRNPEKVNAPPVPPKVPYLTAARPSVNRFSAATSPSRSPRPHRPSAAVSSSRPRVLMLMLLRIASCPSRRVNRCLMPQATLHDALYSFLAHSKRAPLAASATVSAALLQRESPALIGAPSPPTPRS